MSVCHFQYIDPVDNGLVFESTWIHRVPHRWISIINIQISVNRSVHTYTLYGQVNEYMYTYVWILNTICVRIWYTSLQENCYIYVYVTRICVLKNIRPLFWQRTFELGTRSVLKIRRWESFWDVLIHVR